jgi:hypothetical protein
MLHFFIFLFIIFCIQKMIDYFIFLIKVYKFLLLINRITINNALVTNYITYNVIYNKKINISCFENIYIFNNFLVIHKDIYYNLCKVSLEILQMFY